MVYNRIDQLVFFQDAMQRSKPSREWNYTKYDGLGRVTEAGIFATALLRDSLQKILNKETATASTALRETRPQNDTAYDNKSNPRGTSGKKILQLNFYDDYTFKSTTLLPATAGLENTAVVRGMLTGVKVSKDDGTSALLTSTIMTSARV